MPNRRYPPAYLRYLKARLMNLGRPSFWGTAIFLAVLGLLIQEYWANPNLFGQRPDAAGSASDPLSASLSPEDRAIAADIDNLPLLFGINEQFSLPPTTNNTQENNNKNSSPNLAIKPPSTEPKSKPIPNIVNPIAPTQTQNLFVSQSQNLLRFGASDNNHLLGFKSLDSSAESTTATPNALGLSTGLLNQTNQSQNNNQATNSLTTVVNPSTNQNLTPVNGGITSPTNTLINSPLNQTSSPSTRINSPLNSTQPIQYNNFNNGQSFSPNMGINTPTNYLQPRIDNNLNTQPLSSSTNLNSIPSYTQPNTIQPGVYNNSNNGQVVPNQSQITTPVITRTSPIIGPYTIRNPQSSSVINTAPLLPNSYGNSIWQQPNQIPQPDVRFTPYTTQPQGQNRNGFGRNIYR
jgi:hypothetical protein